MTDKTSTPLLSNKAYDVAKNFTVLYIPAAVTAYVGIDAIVDIGPAPEVAAIAAVVLTFLGTVLKISDVKYNNSDAKFDGSLVVDSEAAEAGLYPIQVTATPEEMQGKSEITLKVVEAPAG